jgi:hypothetical protein
MPQPLAPSPSETTLLTRWPDLLATVGPSPWWRQEPGLGGGELQRRVTACYAQLRALPRRTRRALQRKLALPLVGVALLLALSPGLSQAARTATVCASDCAYTTIQAAIDDATTGDVISVRDPVHTEAGIVVTKDLIIAGQGADTTVVQAAASPGTAKDRVVTIAPGMTVTLQGLTIRHGNVADAGGGLLNEGTLTLINSTVSGNAATYGGGGLHNYFSTLTLINSTVSGNTARVGGGLFNYLGTLRLTNSTVSGNAATYGGGGLFNTGSNLFNAGVGTLTLINSTVSGNAAEVGGGLYTYNWFTYCDCSGYAEVGLTNSIIANNPNGGNCHNSSFPSSHGYNLDSDGSCRLTDPTDRPSVDPFLGPLQDNGGPTFTHALLPGSPALDAIPWGTNGCGTTLVGDQRWQARPHAVGGACDIGAYEVEVTGQPLSGWVTGLTPETVTCKDVTTGRTVTLNNPATSWDCEAAGLAVTPGDQASMRVQGPVEPGATDVGGAVTGMAPSSGGCTNLTTGQQVKFQHMVGATAASCVAAGLVVHPGDHLQMSVAGAAE